MGSIDTEQTQRPTQRGGARWRRWSAAHWKTATFGWLAFVIVAFAPGRSASVPRTSTRSIRAG